ncbi:5,6-dimethylbenzimidazole synthase [Planktotalea sp.]|uniref:5,6-dimethylbenzimidazole synthase n=1 Tax=Planktotalea sp. TaxID=2029877 RepID=UPI00329794B3
MTDPEFDTEFRDQLNALFRWRRDVRRFQTTPVDEDLLDRCLQTIPHAPSVGLSEPWRVVRVSSKTARAAALKNFETANEAALAGYSGEDAELYASLKLSGMRDAPVQLAIFCDEDTVQGKGLGAGTMPEMRRYSVVAAIMQFWLSARAVGLGVGWVSILDAPQLSRDLDCPEGWKLVAYLCIGWPEKDTETPELVKAGWESRTPTLDIEDR